ncbi:MAG: hypothetical protein OXI64_09730 [Defluviicoccus sp.]|nr:hypothetical protein [Defluviicoccus sp.]
MSEVLFVVAPYWAQAPASVHRDPDEAIRAAIPLREGCRVLVIRPDSVQWKETEAPHLIDVDDPHNVRQRLSLELRRIGDELANGG